MGHHRSNEDDVHKISTSIFVTNFPDQFSTKDLWKACSQYGRVTDAFIPNRRAISENNKTVSDDSLKKNGVNGYSNSYAHAVKIGHQSHYVERESIPAIVLDDSSGNQCDFATILMGKVKKFSSLTNLKLVLANEGFDCIKVKYMGGFWVMIKFLSEVAKEKFKTNVAIGSWFSKLQRASNDFLIDERVTWVDIEGVPLKVWSKIPSIELHPNGVISYTSKIMRMIVFWVWAKEVSGWTPNFAEENKEDSDTDGDTGDEDLHDDNEGIHKDTVVDEDNEIEEVAETIFEKESSPVHMKDASNDDHIESRSEDPFNIYELLKKKKDNNAEGSNSNDSLKYPPDFTPTVASENQPNACNESVVANEEHLQSAFEQKITSAKKKNVSLSNLKDGREDSVCSGHMNFMSLNIQGLAHRAKKDWVKELCINNKVNFLSLQETKMEAIELLNVKACWGNFAFDYRYSASVGEWVPSGKKLLIISFYAPQELNEKKMLWDYLILVINNWNGEVIIMGNFNEVRKQSERFGSKFNVHGADAFNSFISTASLEELKYLKEKIRMWIKVKKDNSSKNYKKNLKKELTEIDLILDKGEGNSKVLNKRAEVFKSLHDLNKLDSMDVAQKAKIKWAIEGDENSKYFHGILNKKRSQFSIRGIFVDGIWIDSPQSVKNEFFSYFSNRFDQPSSARLFLDSNFPCKLDIDQQADLENNISNEEIKRVVCDCGVDKSPSPDGIQSCLISSRGSVIVNRSLTREFQFHRGLKQGDPLSPFLFIFILESLHISVQRVVDAGLFRGVSIGPSLHLSHLFYADDAVFLGHWSDSNIDTIVRVLDFFYRASGLRINMTKSKIMGISVSSDIVNQAASKIGCAMLKPPFSYLGSKVGGLMSRIQSWDEIMNTLAARLSKWKMKTLSNGGRLTLLKSILGSIPIYHLSLFKSPSKVLQRMESIRCRFFNGIETDSKKQTWIKWNKVLASKEKGGLGVSSFYALNRAPMFKWVWRFCTQGSSLWAKVIKGIHGADWKLDMYVNNCHPSIWLDIVREVKKLKNLGIDLLSFIHKKLRNGIVTSFWDDVWRGDATFKSLYPRLFALESSKSITIAMKSSLLSTK
ncbi:RNA-directed DNA polymerase, eukaryota, reverse transcriptase zinc-binding domain protein [Tanacetum coccineum]